MADEEQDGAESGGGKKKIILLAVVGLLLIGLSVGGTLVALKFFGGDTASEVAAEGEEGATEAAEVEEEIKAPAIYYPLKPTIIVNFNARGKQRYMQAGISLLIRDNDVVAAVEEHSVMLQHGLLMLFSSQDYTELQTAEGKEVLRQKALAEIQRLLEQEIGQPGVEQLLFTNLVMQ